MYRVSMMAFLLMTGCGMESAVVGGVCKAGFIESNGECVPSPNSVSAYMPSTEKHGNGPIGTTDSSKDGGQTTGSVGKTHPTTIEPFEPPTVAPTTPAPVIVEPPIPTPGLVCEPPLVACHGECIDVESDPMNCGACGRICPSNICVARECQGATPGDVVLIGHDMKTAITGSSHARVLANAVGIPTTDPIRVLSYEEGSDTTTSATVRALLGATISRKVSFTTASPEAIESGRLYADYDVVLVEGAAGTDAATLGARWTTSLRTFTKKGGVVVALDNGSSDMPALLASSQLMTVGSRIPFPTTTHFVVTSASDVVARQLLSPFAAFGASVGFDGVEAQSVDLTWVVRAGETGAPTVVHKIVR